MSNQSEHVVEVDHKVKYEFVIEEDCPWDTKKYFAINSLKFELKMNNIKHLKNKDGLILEKDSKPENGSK
ncbi:39853_t:CDS:2 [Gigaspora margarita]|uniref:39853_t:CDS:1 n=1 Tax=Gigaspora margarita TaxID=4874 RepID=A0ABM8W509_GIGMA|nr:39853_t:CDS:2 [Gigaspora margarita]